MQKSYVAPDDMCLAVLDKEGEHVCCGSCKEILGTIWWYSPDYLSSESGRRLSTSKIDRNIARKRMWKLREFEEKAKAEKERTADSTEGENEEVDVKKFVSIPGVKLSAEYIKHNLGVYIPAAQVDKRTKEDRELRVRRDAKLKEAEKLWPRDRSINQLETDGLQLYKMILTEEGPRYEVFVDGDVTTYFVYGTEKQIEEQCRRLNEEYQAKRNEELERRSRAIELRASASYIDERRNGEYFLTLPPFLESHKPIAVQCIKCTRHNALMLGGLSSEFREIEKAIEEKYRENTVQNSEE